MKGKHQVMAWVKRETAEAIEEIVELARERRLGCYNESGKLAGFMLDAMAVDVLRCLRSETYFAKILKVAERARQRREAN